MRNIILHRKGGYEMNLDLIMRNKGVSNADIAKHFATTPSTVSRWRNNINSPDNSLLPELCDFLGCTLDELLRSANPLPSRKVARRKSPRGSGRKRVKAQLAL